MQIQGNVVIRSSRVKGLGFSAHGILVVDFSRLKTYHMVLYVELFLLDNSIFVK